MYVKNKIKLHSEGKDFEISGVCFKFTYLMTNQSLISTFKCNVFLIKIVAYDALNNIKDRPIYF